MNTIRIAGKDYPCRMTMGAMLRFKEQTGREVTEVKGESFTDNLTLLWCCVASACAREKIPFDLSPMEMADSITTEDFAAWQGKAPPGCPPFLALMQEKGQKKIKGWARFARH